MASTNSWTHEIESPVAAPRLFRVGVMDWHTLAPKLAPHIVASAHPVEGEGGIGSVRQFNFTSGTYASQSHTTTHACHLGLAIRHYTRLFALAAMPFSVMKERLEFLDAEKCECKSTLIEGGGIGTAIETATSHIKVEPAASGGSLVKVDSTYKLLPGVEVNDEITKAKESVTAIFKAAEAYLIANPDAYN
uniref:Pathogenesis-related protein 1 n=2 Tax=Aegilops tauschii subsp. strangulata TaxID=200361 RepID=A0A453D196_AEGTS